MVTINFIITAINFILPIKVKFTIQQFSINKFDDQAIAIINN